MKTSAVELECTHHVCSIYYALTGQMAQTLQNPQLIWERRDGAIQSVYVLQIVRTAGFVFFLMQERFFLNLIWTQ